jgi:hypothetical protein
MNVPKPLIPNEPVTLRFSLTPQPVLLRVGERLRFEVGSRTDLLLRDQSHGRAQFQMQVPPRTSRVTPCTMGRNLILSYAECRRRQNDQLSFSSAVTIVP